MSSSVSRSALVTGGSRGIGASFAELLAARGYNLELVSRDASVLEDVAETLRRAHRVRVTAIPADLENPEDLAAIAERAAQTDLLVNNAGFGLVGDVIDLPGDNQLGEIRLNITALTALSHAAAVNMAHRGSGAIINVSSTAGFQPIPHTAVYAATKAYVTSFTQALAEELGPTGVRVLCVCPGYTDTDFQRRAGSDFTTLPGMFVSDPTEVARTALRDLDRGRTVSIPGPWNIAVAAAGKVSPGWITRKVSGQLTRRSATPPSEA